MSQTINVPRELLERLETWVTDDCEALHELQAILAASSKPDGNGLEVVAWLGGNGFHTEEKEATGAPFPLCHLSDAKRVIAELREECEHLRACQENAMLHMTGLVAECERLRVFNKSLDEEATKRLQDVTEAENEAYALRQQLAERDAEILEQCRLNGMGAERELKLIAQRDKLARLLREAHSAGRSRRLTVDELYRINAALTEVEG